MLSRKIDLLVISETDSLLPEIKSALCKTFRHFSVKFSSRLVVNASALPTFVVLDWRLGARECEAFVRHIRRQPQTAYLPVIFLFDTIDDALLPALRYEATDFISFRFLREGLAARVCISLRHRDAYRRLDQQNRMLRQLAAYDDLTGLYNRRYILNALESEARAVEGGAGIGVFLIDLDHFKRVNDTCGHLAGDRVLISFAQLLKDCLRPVDLVGRYGGDEFCLIKPDATPEICIALANRLLECVHEEDFASETGCGFRVTPSIGVAYVEPGTKWTTEEMIAAADSALYKAKQKGRNSFEMVGISPVLAD